MILISKAEMLRLLYCSVAFLLWLTPGCTSAETETGGHIKYFFNYSDYPDKSLFAGEDNPYSEHLGDLRLKLAVNRGDWDARIHYVLNGLYTKNLATCGLGGISAGQGCRGLGSDTSRLFDLSGIITESDDSIVAQRIDRLSLGFANRNNAVRIGRQAISWGNGLAYNPMDLFNPFAPDAIDTEYKTGDDMIYYQHLFDSGNDLQALVLPRRNIQNGNVESDVSALAAKMHWLREAYEADLMVAQNYGDTNIAAAYISEWQENVVNTNIMVTRTENDTVWSAVANYNFSSILTGRNLSGFVELFYNGFGLSGRRHAVDDVLADQDLSSRLLRGELYTIGRYYLAGGILLEVTPLLQFSPTLFFNLGDHSGLLQLLGTYSLTQNIDLLAGFNLPGGADGTEFGGLYTDSEESSLLTPANSLFARLAWYF